MHGNSTSGETVCLRSVLSLQYLSAQNQCLSFRRRVVASSWTSVRHCTSLLAGQVIEGLMF